MGRRKNKDIVAAEEAEERKKREPLIHVSLETKKSLHAIFLITCAIITTLSFFNSAGSFGVFMSQLGFSWFGWGFYSLPLILGAMAGALLLALHSTRSRGTIFAGGMLFLSILGLMQLFRTGAGGGLGGIVAGIEGWFGFWASVIILLSMFLCSIVIMFDIPLFVRKKPDETVEVVNEVKDIVATSSVGGQPEPVVLSGEKNKEASSINKKDENEGGTITDVRPAEKLVSKPLLSIKSDYLLPSIELLEAESTKPIAGDIKVQANIIKRTLEHFGVPVEIGEVNIGSSVTRYAVKPAEGVKLSKITNLHNDLALALAAHPVRIEAPIPGKSWVGIEVPNKACMIIRLKNLLREKAFDESGLLAFAIGRDVTGESVVANLAKMPHLLIAGATGSGKSISIHAFMVSLLFKNTPDTLRFILIDPKRVELSIYNDIPHLIAPVITDGKRAIMSLRWAVQEMEKRYEMLLQEKARDIDTYNQKMSAQKREFMPYIVIVIDELADLMVAAGSEVESAIIRLAQMARAVGIHLVIATQRPSVDIITGLIKANITSRIAFSVASQTDSRTILDTAGAEKLLGRGDMLFTSAELSKPRRLQGTFVSDEEIVKITEYLKKDVNEVEYNNEITSKQISSSPGIGADESDDLLFGEAKDTILRAGKASASLLQRRLKIGYARAARLLDIMEEQGIIGPADGAKPREVLMSINHDDNINDANLE